MNVLSGCRGGERSVGIDSRLCRSPLRGACGVLRRALRGWYSAHPEPHPSLSLRAACGVQIRSRRICRTKLEPIPPSPPSAKKRAPIGALLRLAVREGFEPSIRVNVYTLSRRAPSASRTPHQNCCICRFAKRLPSHDVLVTRCARPCEPQAVPAFTCRRQDVSLSDTSP